MNANELSTHLEHFWKSVYGKREWFGTLLKIKLCERKTFWILKGTLRADIKVNYVFVKEAGIKLLNDHAESRFIKLL